jgi:MYND finger
MTASRSAHAMFYSLLVFRETERNETKHVEITLKYLRENANAGFETLRQEQKIYAWPTVVAETMHMSFMELIIMWCKMGVTADKFKAFAKYYWGLQKAFMSPACENCLTTTKPTALCANCHETSYCGKECQKADWKTHKQRCKLITKAHEVVRRMLLNKNTPSERLQKLFENESHPMWEID